MWCQKSDEPVVVNKSRPVKAGNSLEEKTATTACKKKPVGKPSESRWTVLAQKAIAGCEGVKFYQVDWERHKQRTTGSRHNSERLKTLRNGPQWRRGELRSCSIRPSAWK